MATIWRHEGRYPERVEVEKHKDGSVTLWVNGQWQGGAQKLSRRLAREMATAILEETK